jgi:hypothetical protein
MFALGAKADPGESVVARTQYLYALECQDHGEKGDGESDEVKKGHLKCTR